jgi:hypothetical protein
VVGGDGLVIALRPQTPKHIRAAGHIILTPANQLMEEYKSEPPEQSCLLRWTEKIASL